MLKRVFDFLVASLSMVLLMPVMLVVAAAVAIFLGRPVMFLQQRPGLHGRPFRMVKFRSMRDDRDASGAPLPDEERLTAFGRFLRRSSLDELPELWNVLKGEMSLVGPRPLLMEYLPRYTPEQMRRHDVLPGITGWAQVNGRNALDWEDNLRMDVWYVDHASLWLDMKILLLTVKAVLSARGVSPEGKVTREKFRGQSR